MKIVDQQWRFYSEAVIAVDAGTAQRMECRRAFYAGAQAFYGIMMTMLDPGAEPTDADLALMAALHEELQRFAADVLAGRA